MPKFSLVIRCYNEEKHIAKLLQGIQLQSVDDLEIILVDSGSTDETVSIARKFGAQIVHIAKADFSFGRALNRGCEVAQGEILIFASAHVYPLRTDWLAELTAPFEDPEIVLTYGRQVGNEVTKFSERQVFDAWFPATSVARQPHYFCNNANCAIRRSEWKLRRYDETLTGLEDLAWAKLARQQGGQIAYVASAPIVHIHEETPSRVRNRYRREAMALRQIEPTIQFGFADFLGLTLKNILADVNSAIHQKLLACEWRSICSFRFNQFYGTYQGHRWPSEVDNALRNRFYYPASESCPPASVGESRFGSTEKAMINYEY